MDWIKYFERMIKMLRLKEDRLNEEKKSGAAMYNSSNGEFGIDHNLREINSITNGAISLLDFLLNNEEISEQDAKKLKYELGWLETDTWAIRLGTYPTPHLSFDK